MKLNEFIKKFRLERNLTQKEFAEMCHLDQSRISLIEEEKANVGFSTFEKLSEVTGKTVTELRKMKYEKH